MQNNPTPTLPNAKELLDQFLSSRNYSTSLIEGLSPEDCQAQSMEDASPAKWHLAHVTWFYEVMVLQRFEKNFRYWNPAFAVLFNSYYNGVGDKHPRNKRGLLTRPSLDEVLEWRSNIDQRITNLIQHAPSQDSLWLIVLGINHEQQHQELLLTDLHHLFSQNALLPVYFNTHRQELPSMESFKWLEGVAGLVDIGYSAKGFHFDNESPCHKVYLQPYLMSNQLITNGQWISFIEDGGYQNSKWWLDAGWTWVNNELIQAPLYWTFHKNKPFHAFSLFGLQPIDPSAPVTHISYFEADAFTRWASANLNDLSGARLPTEYEWESFAKNKSSEAIDLLDKVWQWTSSNYTPYPGYQPWEGVAGEYNGKFMVNQMVLRGSSDYTTKGHSRLSYRNFFPTHVRWQRTGLRVAKDHS
jgi:ergothioneine biosynthesis protein EgtB